MLLPTPQSPNCCYPSQTACPPTTQIPGPQGDAGVGVDGTNGISCFTNAIESFVMPAIGASVTFAVVGSTAFAVGMYVWVEVAGEMKVVSKPDSASIELENTGWSENAAETDVIPTGVQISPTGKSAAAP